MVELQKILHNTKENEAALDERAYPLSLIAAFLMNNRGNDSKGLRFCCAEHAKTVYDAMQLSNVQP